MTEGGYELVKLRVYPRATDVFDSRLALPNVFNTTIDLGISLSHKLRMAQSRIGRRRR